MRERLQKWIAQTGAASRRQAEEWIRSGRVTVNGVPAALGQSVDTESDVVLLDGAALQRIAEKPVYVLLNKPRGYVCTAKDERGRKTVLDLLEGVSQRVYPVGRLDMYSEGLLLLTNDGALTRALTHPSADVEKQYQVRVTGDIESAMTILRAPMSLDGRPLKPFRVRVLKRGADSSLLLFVISEGRNRQIRRMCELAGLKVVRLRRIAEGELRLGDLREGEWRYLHEEEVERLRKAIDGNAKDGIHANTAVDTGISAEI